MSRMTDAYVAGLIDGEGCIYAAKAHKGTGYTIRIDVGMTAKALPILKRLEVERGGKVRLTRRATEKWEEAHAWAVFGPAAAALLRDIQPHLVLKDERAQLALRLEEIRQSLIPQGSQRATWTDDASGRCERIRLRIMELNRKGPTPPTSGMPGVFAHLVAGQWQVLAPRLEEAAA